MIEAIHGCSGQEDSQFPEEWIISTVVARNAGREDYPFEGICFVKDQHISLRDLIGMDPKKTLGEPHLRRVGEISTGVLVKIIDAAERLTIQVHPTKEKARELFDSEFGKTECWHILGGREIGGQAPCIYFGFKPGVTREEWKHCFDEQDIPAMLNCLHRFDVQPGETYLIEGGVPHAIGGGCLLIEIQEPTDYTVRTERATPSGLKIADFMCHQGLGFERMFDCFMFDGLSKEETYARWCISPKTNEKQAQYEVTGIVGYENTTCFKLEKYTIHQKFTVPCGEVFSGLYILSGEGTIQCGDRIIPLRGGDQFFIPAVCKPFKICAGGEEPIVCFRCWGPEVEGL